MSVYIYPIISAVFTFVALAFVLMLPYVVFQYFKHGSVSLIKALILWSFLFYLICIYYLVILPLPKIEVVEKMTGSYLQLIPFQFVTDFKNASVLVLGNAATYLPAMRQSVFLQPLFNIIMMIPLGIYLRYYFKFGFIKVLLCGFGLSLFFELTQLSGLYGIYPRPYRIFDVDDLMLNTLGSVCGYLLAPVISMLLPSKEQIEIMEYKKSFQVSKIRRFIAYMLDYLICDMVYRLAVNVFGYTYQYSIFMLLFLSYLWLVPLILSYQTLGMKIVHIRISSDNQMNGKKIFGRVLLFGLGFHLIPHLLSNALNEAVVTVEANGLLLMVTIFLSLMHYIILSVHVLVAIIRKTPLYYEKLSQTKIISTFNMDESDI